VTLVFCWACADKAKRSVKSEQKAKVGFIGKDSI
jgi:hypothetical protein